MVSSKVRESVLFLAMFAGLLTVACGKNSDTTVTAKPCGAGAVDATTRSVVRLESDKGSGSGFLLKDARIVTAFHVIEGSTQITVHYPDGEDATGALSF